MLAALIIALIAGWLTGQIMKGSGYGMLMDIVLGLVGGLIGGFLFGALGLSANGAIGQMIMATVGGVVLVALSHALHRA
jgi:uncharacterized membrane protein YeaQ/YmgE (transglycosylase-associated protein family)